MGLVVLGNAFKLILRFFRHQVAKSVKIFPSSRQNRF
jgi:hypothetical protein